MSAKKFYVVWVGKKPGIYTSWQECRVQIEGVAKAKYKSFKTKDMAERALNSSPENYIGQKVIEPELSEIELAKIGSPILDSICVDGACNMVTGDAEYRGVTTNHGKELFRKGPFAGGTNNVVEFLGIVHALAYCKQRNLHVPIYSDSVNAIKWVIAKHPKTKLVRTAKNSELFTLIDRAVVWLENNSYPNQLKKWETKAWGENPADFGRK